MEDLTDNIIKQSNKQTIKYLKLVLEFKKTHPFGSSEGFIKHLIELLNKKT